MKPRDRIRYECSSLREHAAFLEERSVQLQAALPMREEPFLTTFSAGYMPKAYVARVRYGAAFHVMKSEPAWSWHHVLSMPVEGRIRSTTGNRESAAHPFEFAMRPPASQHGFETAERTDEVFLAIDPDHLRTACARLLGRPVHGEIAFDLVMSAHAPHARAIRSACEMYLGASPAATAHAATARDAQFQDFFVTTLLMHHPHTHWRELTGHAPLPAPGDVKRTLDYIHANLAGAIRLEDLIEIANVPGRTLNEHFRRFLGISPMGYVRQQRLKLARRLLLDGDAASVTDIATRCGFFHLGRFSIEYRCAFGESPSQTRARAAKPARRSASSRACQDGQHRADSRGRA